MSRQITNRIGNLHFERLDYWIGWEKRFARLMTHSHMHFERAVSVLHWFVLCTKLMFTFINKFIKKCHVPDTVWWIHSILQPNQKPQQQQQQLDNLSQASTLSELACTFIGCKRLLLYQAVIQMNQHEVQVIKNFKHCINRLARCAQVWVCVHFLARPRMICDRFSTSHI